MKMRFRVPLIVLVCAKLLSFPPAPVQFSQQGPKLAGTGAVGNALEGASVSLSGDADAAIVAANLDNSNAVAVCVFAAPPSEREILAAEASAARRGRLACPQNRLMASMHVRSGSEGLSCHR